MATRLPLFRPLLSRPSTASPFTGAICSLISQSAPLRPTQCAPTATAAAPSRPNLLPGIRHASSSSARKGPPAKQLTKRQREAQAQRDPRITEMIKTLALTSADRARPPLRMARNRHLRHWTIHRAWLLCRRRAAERRRRELMRQYQSMQAACEELRRTRGPGERDEGYLFRVAMEKHGVFGHDGIPIEYTRPLTETPARVAWNHDWKR